MGWGIQTHEERFVLVNSRCVAHPMCLWQWCPLGGSTMRHGAVACLHPPLCPPSLLCMCPALFYSLLSCLCTIFSESDLTPFGVVTCYFQSILRLCRHKKVAKDLGNGPVGYQNLMCRAHRVQSTSVRLPSLLEGLWVQGIQVSRPLPRKAQLPILCPQHRSSRKCRAASSTGELLGVTEIRRKGRAA